jgi:hypothetical protein
MSFKFNPLTGELDISEGGEKNFSLKEINQEEIVPDGQQMLFSGDIEINETLELSGVIEQIVDYSDWSFGWNNIPLLKNIKIPVNRDLLFYATMEINGTVTVDGRLIEVT